MNLITPDFGTIFWQTITFIFVLFILKKFAWSKILSSITAREHKIQGALEAAKQAKKQLELFEEKSKEILSKANMESEHMTKEAISVRDQIIRDSKTEAKSISDEIISKARTTIDQEKKLAIQEVKNQIADLVVLATEKVMSKKFSDDKENLKLLDETLSSNNFLNKK